MLIQGMQLLKHGINLVDLCGKWTDFVHDNYSCSLGIATVVTIARSQSKRNNMNRPSFHHKD